MRESKARMAKARATAPETFGATLQMQSAQTDSSMHCIRRRRGDSQIIPEVRRVDASCDCNWGQVVRMAQRLTLPRVGLGVV